MVRIIDVTDGENAESSSNKKDGKTNNDNKNDNKNNSNGNGNGNSKGNGNGANDSINCRKKETGLYPSLIGLSDELNEMAVDIAKNGQPDDIIGQAVKGLGQQNGNIGHNIIE